MSPVRLMSASIDGKVVARFRVFPSGETQVDPIDPSDSRLFTLRVMSFPHRYGAMKALEEALARGDSQ